MRCRARRTHTKASQSPRERRHTGRFRAAAQEAKVGPEKDITDLQLMRLL
jgi:hypothetical protein